MRDGTLKPSGPALRHAAGPSAHAFGRRGESYPEDTFTLTQVHGATVVAIAGDPPRPSGEEGDALVTDRPGVAVGVVTADCLPVLLAGPDGRVVGAVHAGWRGTLAGVATAAVTAIEARYGLARGDLTALMGPCIRPCCFEVGPEVSEAVRARFPQWAARVLAPGRGTREHMDLAALNALQLGAAGVRAVHDRGGCTHCQPEQYHSFRRDGPGAGRMVSWIRAAG